jgi:Short-chain dehydrogenases of various substrate specificities
LTYFLKQGHGKIINMAGAGSSEKKFDSTACISAYAATKAAIKRMTFSLAEEYKDTGIEIMLLNPGMVRTEILGTRHLRLKCKSDWNAFAPFKIFLHSHPAWQLNWLPKWQANGAMAKLGYFFQH